MDAFREARDAISELERVELGQPPGRGRARGPGDDGVLREAAVPPRAGARAEFAKALEDGVMADAEVEVKD